MEGEIVYRPIPFLLISIFFALQPGLMPAPIAGLPPAKIVFAQVLPDGSKLLTVGEDSHVHILEAVTGKMQSTFALYPKLGCRPVVALSHDGNTLASACEKGIKLWDVSTGQSNAEFIPFGGSRCTSHILFATNDKVLAVVHFIPQTGSSLPMGIKYFVRCYEVPSGKLREDFGSLYSRRRLSLLFSGDSKQLVVSGDQVQIFNFSEPSK